MAPEPTYYVYGEPDLPGVVSVRVFGDGFVHTVPLDETTGGYAVAVPQLEVEVIGPFATVEFLDADGVVVGTEELVGR